MYFSQSMECKLSWAFLFVLWYVILLVFIYTIIEYQGINERQLYRWNVTFTHRFKNEEHSCSSKKDSYKLFRKTINYRTKRKNNIVTHCVQFNTEHLGIIELTNQICWFSRHFNLGKKVIHFRLYEFDALQYIQFTARLILINNFRFSFCFYHLPLDLETVLTLVFQVFRFYFY